MAATEQNTGDVPITATPWTWCDPAKIPRRTPEQRAKHDPTSPTFVVCEEGIDIEAYVDAALAHHAKLQARAVRATPFKLRDGAQIPPREWIYGRHYIRRFLTATFGAGGGGKSSHAVTEAIAMATCKRVLGEPAKRPARVWYVNAEDPPEEIERRFTAAAEHFNVSDSDLGGNLFTDSGRAQSFVVAREVGRETRIVEPVVSGLIEEILEREIDVLIVDPFVSTHEVSENDNARIQRVAEQWVRVAEEANCAVELIHHTRKGEGEKTADDGRGAGALVAKARSVRVINPMTPAQADEAGIPTTKMHDYFRVEFSKTNLARRGALPQWRRLVSVPLRNGGSGNLAFLQGDEIGVVALWEWPASETLIDDVSPEAFEAIKARIGGGDSRADPTANNWAGHHVGDILKIETDLRDGRKRVKRMLDAWIEGGHFEVVERLDSTRHMKKFIDCTPCGT